MVAIQAAFQEALQKLNSAQRQAVESIEGAVMVVAGPGTGKTQVLALRVGWILEQTDTPPPAVLVLTFTEAAAQNMRRRLVSLLGPTAYGVRIATFHGWCSSVIRDWPEYFPLPRGSQPLSDLDRFQLFEALMAELPLKQLRPLNDATYYLRDVMSAVSQLKRESVTPDKLHQLLEVAETELAAITSKTELTKRRRHLSKQRELHSIFTQYQQALLDRRAYDYDDMISLVVQAFQAHPELLETYQEELLYIMVDEYQDTNTSQNRVVELLASYWGDQANLCVVGDPHQSIYRFQGASLENVLGFMDRYPQAQVIALEQGYRCPQAIYDVAHEIIEKNTALPDSLKAAAVPLQAVSTSHVPPIKVLAAPSQLMELVWVAEQLRYQLDQGTPAEQMAVLFRHNRDAQLLQDVLTAWNIPFQLDDGQDALQLEPIRQLLSLFESILKSAEPEDEGELFQVLQQPWWQLPSLGLIKIARVAGKTHRTITQVIESGHVDFLLHDSSPQLSSDDFTRFERVLDQLKKWWQLDSQVVVTEWFETVIKESGFLEWVRQQPEQFELLSGLQTVFLHLKNWAGAAAATQHRLHVSDFLANIETLREHSLGLPVSQLHLTTDAVQLCTVHKAKGREWQFVYMLHVIDGKWGNNRTRQLLPLPEGVLTHTSVSKLDHNQDERRLFYVALTRASSQVVVSYPETFIASEQVKEVIPSQFVVELQQSTQAPQMVTQTPALQLSDDEILARLLGESRSQFAAARSDAAQHRVWQQLVHDFVLSPTSLNTYLRDPNEFVERVLLRLPQAKAAHLAYGTAIHTALEFLYTALLRDKPLPPLAAVNQAFSTALQAELLTDDEFTRRHDHGLEVLERYYRQLASQHEVGLLPQPLHLERFFGTNSQPVMLGDIPLKGRVDRVDWLDMSTKSVEVLDYKTGSPKTENWINGGLASQKLSARERSLPPAIKGPYKRQLLFYKLLADLDPSFTSNATHGSFIFVEDEKEPIIRRFEYASEDLQLLKQLIVEVMTEVRELRFLDT